MTTNLMLENILFLIAEYRVSKKDIFKKGYFNRSMDIMGSIMNRNFLVKMVLSNFNALPQYNTINDKNSPYT